MEDFLSQDRFVFCNENVFGMNIIVGMNSDNFSDSFNTFYHEMVMRIDSTGKMIELTLHDSIYLF